MYMKEELNKIDCSLCLLIYRCLLLKLMLLFLNLFFFILKSKYQIYLLHRII